MGPEGVREWQGWSFATMDFWTRTNTGQQRDAFTLAQNIIAVADPDEWDDRNNPSATGTFNSTLISPSVPISANTTTYLSFDSHYLQESPQEAKITVSFDGGPEQILLHYSSNPGSDNGGNHAANRRVQILVPSQPSATNATFRWTVYNARNNWYWAVDDILLSDSGPTPTPTPSGTRTATPTPTFDPNQPTHTPLPSGLVGRWLFDSGHVAGGVVEDLAGDLDGTIVSSLGLQASPPCIVLDGQDDWVSLAVKGSPISLPPETLTAEAWVSLNATTRWGGIVGAVQDNGSFEKGWILGYDDDQFTFAVSVGGILKYLEAPTPLVMGQWHHVVGTYDGVVMRIYLNGELETIFNDHPGGAGPIDYSPADYVIGVYKDDNEFWPLDGKIHEVDVYNRVLTPEEVRANYDAKKSLFPAGPTLPTRTPTPVPPPTPVPFITLGPYLQFTANTEAKVMWETDGPLPSIVEYGIASWSENRVEDLAPKTVHSLTLTGLEPGTKYQCLVKTIQNSVEVPGESFQFNTAFNYTVPDFPNTASPYPPDALTPLYEQAAQWILDHSGITKGYCLDYGCGTGRLAYEIAKRSDLVVLGVTSDPAKASTARASLKQAGVYGSRVTIQIADLSQLSYPDYFANLVVSDDMVAAGTLPGNALEVTSKVRPCGGMAFFGQTPSTPTPLSRTSLENWLGGVSSTITQDSDGLWAKYERDCLPGGGSWTHQYGDAGQTASSQDELLSGKTGETIEVQWFGRPGPDAMIDRQSRNQGPLATNGRLFTQGLDRLIVQDAFNGAICWSLEIPESRRVNVKVDTSNACLDDDSIFLAVRDRCWRMDAASGDRLASYPVSDTTPAHDYDWGFTTTVGTTLFGSAIRHGAIYTAYQTPAEWYDSHVWGYGTYPVCSDYLFGVNKETGARLWTYTQGLIINPTISVGGGRVYFVESRNPTVLASSQRRVSNTTLWSDLYLTALNANTGTVVWQRPVTYGAPIVLYLLYSNEKVLVTASTNQYNIFTYNASNGVEGWSQSHAWPSNNHGHHVQHPVITEGKVFLESKVYDLASGALLPMSMPGRSKCGTITAAAHLLHYRDYFDEVWDLATGQTSEFNGLRSSCWLGALSADGMLLYPESGGGCNCQFPIQTSIGYRTKDDY